MANEEDKERSQRLVDEAARQYVKAKSQHEKRQWAETHLPLLEQAISLDPDNYNAWVSRGTAKSELGDLEGAIADCDKAIALNRNNDAAWCGRGVVKSKLGDHQGAIDDHTEAIKLNRNNDVAWSSRGGAKSALGDHQGAITDCDEAIKLNPNNDVAWSSRGAAKGGLGDHKGAIADCDEAIKINSKNDIAWSNRGAARSALGDHQGAIEDLDKAIELNSDNFDAWNNRGVAKYRLGDFDGAISDLRKALELNPKKDAIRRNLEAAEIALASHKNAEKPQKDKNKYHTRLRKRAKKHEKKFNTLIKRRRWLFIFIITIIIIFIERFIKFFYWYVDEGCDSDPCQAIGELNFFTLWPYFMFMFVCLMPFFVMLRLNIQDAKRELILKEDFHGRYIVELYLERFFSAEPDRRNFAEKYISYWMHNNPSETLLRLDKKSSDQSDAAHIDIMRELIRNQKPPS